MKRANKIKKLSKTDPPVKLKAKTCKEQSRRECCLFVDHIRENQIKKRLFKVRGHSNAT